MTPTEYGLLAVVILVPLAIAVMVTLWSLEQARARTRKNRKTPNQRPPANREESASPE